MIKANKELFEMWKMLSAKVSSLAAIVQNDTEFNDEYYDEWEDAYNNILEEMDNTYKKTYEYYHGVK